MDLEELENQLEIADELEEHVNGSATFELDNFDQTESKLVPNQLDPEEIENEITVIDDNEESLLLKRLINGDNSLPTDLSKSGLQMVADMDLGLSPPLSPLSVPYDNKENNSVTKKDLVTVYFTEESYYKYSVKHKQYLAELHQSIAKSKTLKPELPQPTERKHEIITAPPKAKETKIGKTILLTEESTKPRIRKATTTNLTEKEDSKSTTEEVASTSEALAPKLPSVVKPPVKPKEVTSIDTLLEQKQQFQQQMLQLQRQQSLQPRFSSLSEEEHTTYLDLIPKFIKDQQRNSLILSNPSLQITLPPPLLSPDTTALFIFLRSKVVAEQEDYRIAQYQDAMLHSDRYLVLHQDIEKQLEKVYSYKRQLVKNYPRYYQVYSAFDLRAIKVAPNDPVLKHRATVLQIGKCLAFEPPTSREIPLTTNFISIDDLPTTEPKTKWTKKAMPRLTEDPHAMDLASRHGADIVMTSSALTTLIDNHDPRFSEAWEIPIIAKTLKKSDSETGKVIFLEKPLIAKKQTCRDKNSYFYDKAFKSLTLQLPSVQQGVEFEQPKYNINLTTRNPGSEQSSSVNFEEENYTYNLWQFGDFKILIRCKIHGMITDSKTPHGYRFIGIKSKLEYLPNKGYEEITISETARWWIYTYIRPDAHLMLARVNVLESKFMNFEHKDMPSILFPGCLFKPEKSSKILYVLLDKLQGLEEGSFLLAHKSGDHNVAIYEGMKPENLSESTDSKRYYDLWESHKSSPLTDTETIPYIPIRWTSCPNQIPDTFPINKNLKSIIPQFVPSKELCPNFRQFGVCNIPNCPMIHKAIDPKQVALQKRYSGAIFCYSFATTGNCKLGDRCKYPHLTIEELETKRINKRKSKKRRNKKKKKSKAESSATSNSIEDDDGGSSDGSSEIESNKTSESLYTEEIGNEVSLDADLQYIMSQM